MGGKRFLLSENTKFQMGGGEDKEETDIVSVSLEVDKRVENNSNTNETSLSVLKVANNLEQEIVITEKPQNEIFCPKFPYTTRRFRLVSVTKFIIIIIMIIILVLVFILTIIPNSPIMGWLIKFLTWVENIPTYGKIACLIVLYCVSAPFGVPISPINLASGFLFHFWIGFVVAITGSMLGAEICYVWGKTLLYSWSIRQMHQKKILRALALAVNTKAIRLIILTHLSPILPASVLHYFFAAIGVPMGKFFIGTFLGITPFLIVYVYIGSISRSLTSALSGEDRSSIYIDIAWVLFVIIGSIVILGVVTWFGKRELNKALQVIDNLENQETEIDLPSIQSTDPIPIKSEDTTEQQEISTLGEYTVGEPY